jgi:hypothetical protein
MKKTPSPSIPLPHRRGSMGEISPSGEWGDGLLIFIKNNNKKKEMM